MLLTESAGDLQLALDAVSQWGLQWRFSFGIGPQKSRAVAFDPNRQRPACSVTLGGSLLPVVQSHRHLGVLLTHSLRGDAHAEHLLSRGHRLFAQCASWARAEWLPMSLSHSLLAIFVLPSATFLAWSSWAVAIAVRRGVMQLCVSGALLAVRFSECFGVVQAWIA